MGSGSATLEGAGAQEYYQPQANIAVNGGSYVLEVKYSQSCWAEAVSQDCSEFAQGIVYMGAFVRVDLTVQ